MREDLRKNRRFLIISLFFILGLLIPTFWRIKVGGSHRARTEVRIRAPSDPKAMDIFMKNEMELAKSYAVMERIAYKMGLIKINELSLKHESGFYGKSKGENLSNRRPTERVRRIVESIRSRIEVENPRMTNLLLFTAVAETGAEAVKLARIAAQQYIEERTFLERENLEEEVRYILSELKTREKELEEAKKEISDYLRQHPDFIPSSNVRSISSLIAKYSRDLEEINVDINSCRRELQVVKSLIEPTKITPQYIARISSFSMRLISDPIISALIEEMRRLQSKRAKLLRHYTEIHPKVKENQARIEKVSSRLAEEIKTKLQADMDRISGEISDLEKRRDMVQRKIDTARKQISRLSRLQGEYALIESKARSLSELCSMLRGKLEEYRLKMLEKPDIAVIVEPARVLPSSRGIKRYRSMTIGGLIGLLIGIALTTIRPRRASRKEISPLDGRIDEIQIPILIVPGLEWDELMVSYADDPEAMRAVNSLLPEGVDLILGYSPDGRRTSLGFNLAIYRARKGVRTVLVGFAPQDERLSRLFGVEEIPGLTDISHDPNLLPQVLRTATDMLFGVIEVETLASAHGIDYLSLLPYGTDRRINMENLEKVLSDLRGWYKSVILDCTSALPDQIDRIRALADGILIACHMADLRSRGFSSLLENLSEERSKSVVVALR